MGVVLVVVALVLVVLVGVVLVHIVGRLYPFAILQITHSRR